MKDMLNRGSKPVDIKRKTQWNQHYGIKTEDGILGIERSQSLNSRKNMLINGNFKFPSWKILRNLFLSYIDTSGILFWKISEGTSSFYKWLISWVVGILLEAPFTSHKNTSEPFYNYLFKKHNFLHANI